LALKKKKKNDMKMEHGRLGRGFSKKKEGIGQSCREKYPKKAEIKQSARKIHLWLHASAKKRLRYSGTEEASDRETRLKNRTTRESKVIKF
jgi:hypothetical protein